MAPTARAAEAPEAAEASARTAATRAAGTTSTPDDVAPRATAPGAAQRPDLVTLAVRRVLPLVLLLGTLAALVRSASRPLSNPDTYFHLRFGREFLDGAWSLRAPGSVTTLGTADWVPTQWLPQLAMAGLERWGGLAAVAWFSGLQLVLLAVTLYLLARRVADPLVSSVLLIAVLWASQSGLSMRPQVVSYLLVAVAATLWWQAVRGGRVPWVLVPLTWLWTTYHGMWPVGIVVGLAAVLGAGLDGTPRPRLVRLAAVPVLSAVAAALTPVGPGLYGAVLTVNSRASYFSEWAPPDLVSAPGAALLLVVGLPVVVMMRGRERSSWTAVLLLGAAIGFGVYSSRTVPVAACLALPLAASSLQRLVGPCSRPVRAERVTVLGGAVVALAVLAAVVPSTAARVPGQPGWAEPALSSLPAGTRIINDQAFGGPLMWAHPQLDVVMSGYGDIYTDAELERNSLISGVGPGWLEAVDATGAQWALVSTRTSLGYDLQVAGWTAVHRSAEVELLRAPAPDGS